METICAPAKLYLIFSLVLTTIVFIILSTNEKINQGNLRLVFIVNIITIGMSTLMLMGLCNISKDISWAIVIIIIALTILGSLIPTS